MTKDNSTKNKSKNSKNNNNDLQSKLMNYAKNKNNYTQESYYADDLSHKKKPKTNKKPVDLKVRPMRI
jgi:hypothetical protein